MHPNASDQVNAFIGTGIVAHEVAEIQNSVRLVFKVTEYRLKSLDVGVNIRENRYPHYNSLGSAGGPLNFVAFGSVIGNISLSSLLTGKFVDLLYGNCQSQGNHGLIFVMLWG